MRQRSDGCVIQCNSDLSAYRYLIKRMSTCLNILPPIVQLRESYVGGTLLVYISVRHATGIATHKTIICAQQGDTLCSLFSVQVCCDDLCQARLYCLGTLEMDRVLHVPQRIKSIWVHQPSSQYNRHAPGTRIGQYGISRIRLSMGCDGEPI